MQQLSWHEEPSRIFVAETPLFRMVVERCGESEHIRFLVREKCAVKTEALVASGVRGGFSEAMAAAEQVAGQLAAIAARSRALVIVVDDDATVRDCVAETLRDCGFDVAEADSGERALVMIAHSTRPIVVVCDVNLGGGPSGLDLADEIHARWPQVVVVLTTGDDVAAMKIMADDVLLKPFTTAELIGCVAAVDASAHMATPVNVH